MTGGHKSNAGFTYIEVLMAMAIFVIIAVPVFPVLSQAMANHNYAVQRRAAQGYAVTLALEVGAAPDNAAAIVQRLADDNFIYRVSLFPIDGTARHYIAGNTNIIAEAQNLPEPGGASFNTAFSGLFTDGTFIVAEVFDSRGNLAGLSVGKVN